MTTIAYSLLLIIGMLYLPFLGNAFVSDDFGLMIYQSAGWTVPQILGWPMTIHLGGILQLIIHTLVGNSPWLYRLANILFHGAAAIYVYKILTKLTTPRIGMITGLIFAVHPMAIESVTWISGGAYALTAMLFLVSFWQYINRKYYYSYLFYALSLLTSEKSLALFLIPFAYEWFSIGERGGLAKNWKKLMPYLLLSTVLIIFYLTRVGLRIEGISGSGGFNNIFLQIPAAISTYLNLFLWPKNLTLYHASFVFSPASYAIRAIITLIFIGLGIWGLIKKAKPGFWVVWFIAGLLPTLNPLKLGWIVAERYAYLASIGIYALLAIGFDWFYQKRKNIAATAGIIILLGLSIRTVARNREWRNEDTLWPATLRESPQSVYSWNNMGDVYSRAGNEERAGEMFIKATLIDPGYPDAHHNLGNSYLNRKMYQEAGESFKKAISLNPNLWQSYQGLAVISDIQGNYKEALDYLEKALAITQNAQLLRNYNILRKLKFAVSP